MNRRKFLKLGSLALAGLGLNGKFHQAGELPNILIIYADQHNAELLGCTGNTDIKTPNLDALAKDGVLYNNSFCCFPVCTPSRYSFFSGLYVNRHRGWTNHSTLQPKLPTFPAQLKRAGYSTAAVGKMHFTPTYLDIGFERMVLAEQNGPGRWEDDYHRYLMQNDLVDENDVIDQVPELSPGRASPQLVKNALKPSNLDEKHHSTTWIADRAIEQLKKWHYDQPNLLMVSFIKPHHPFDPPIPWDKTYDPAKIKLPDSYTRQTPQADINYNIGYYNNPELSERNIKQALAFYCATISQIDHHLARLISQLKKTGAYDNTMIIYSSDHGDYAGHHHMLLKGNYMYDPIMKVPLIIKWPGNTHAGTTSNKLINNIDIAPTILELAGQPVPPDIDGIAIQSNRTHKYIFAEFNFSRQLMIRSHRHKLIIDRNNDKKLFFDLTKDPCEFVNLVDSIEYGSLIEQLEKALLEWAGDDPTPQNYVNTAAACIDQPNVPTRQQIRLTKEYYLKKMKHKHSEINQI